MFINFSNHPQTGWSEAQLAAARGWGEIIDLPFPAVDPCCDEAALLAAAKSWVERIMAYRPQAVLCQGEFGLAFAVTALLQAQGITVVNACSQRLVQDSAGGKLVRFEFTRFREYVRLAPTGQQS